MCACGCAILSIQYTHQGGGNFIYIFLIPLYAMSCNNNLPNYLPTSPSLSGTNNKIGPAGQPTLYCITVKFIMCLFSCMYLYEMIVYLSVYSYLYIGLPLFDMGQLYLLLVLFVTSQCGAVVKKR